MYHASARPPGGRSRPVYPCGKAWKTPTAEALARLRNRPSAFVSDRSGVARVKIVGSDETLRGSLFFS